MAACSLIFRPCSWTSASADASACRLAEYNLARLASSSRACKACKTVSKDYGQDVSRRGKAEREIVSVLTSTMVRFRFSIPAVFSLRFFSSSSRTFKNERLAGSVKRLTAREMAKNCRAVQVEVEALILGDRGLTELGY